VRFVAIDAHPFSLDDIAEAYEPFGERHDDVTKVLITPSADATHMMATPLDGFMPAIPEHTFRHLTPEECRALLTRNHVGRIAFSLHDQVDIEPINYVAEGEWIFGRTSEGSKLAKLRRHPRCAFEVDEVRGLFDWSSVVVKGTFSTLDAKAGSLHTYQRANSLLWSLVPGTFSAGDPVPHRSVIFGVFAQEMTGRTAHP
jgi:nitroimidazol reductase NimA-like FMN-containing flavoprotein (pyridoxamine 5'-phosphate oxidase superfamily)